eukprot:TRINITY_DN72065_c0_g1_i1.p1 TRINITY_DN72065_c0_g1~~TRINITY_DN72065_c0_g1_i1.p1  ORF type:complete len:400 (+),score=70.68 TRINITY_DN72065_c0_g1_i1:98-1297(+)
MHGKHGKEESGFDERLRKVEYTQGELIARLAKVAPQEHTRVANTIKKRINREAVERSKATLEAALFLWKVALRENPLYRGSPIYRRFHDDDIDGHFDREADRSEVGRNLLKDASAALFDLFSDCSSEADSGTRTSTGDAHIRQLENDIRDFQASHVDLEIKLQEQIERNSGLVALVNILVEAVARSSAVVELPAQVLDEPVGEMTNCRVQTEQCLRSCGQAAGRLLDVGKIRVDDMRVLGSEQRSSRHHDGDALSSLRLSNDASEMVDRLLSKTDEEACSNGVTRCDDIFSQLCILLMFADNQWKKLAKGVAKIIAGEEGRAAQFLMMDSKQQVTILNHDIIIEKHCCQLVTVADDARALAWTLPPRLSGQKRTRVYSVKFATVDLATSFMTAFNTCAK